MDNLFYNLPFAESHYILPITSFCYLFFVYIIGPRLMKDRLPIKSIKKIMVYYNLLQIIANAYLIYMAVSDIGFLKQAMSNLYGNYTQDLIFTRSFVRLGYLWCLLKISDYLDTVFFILLKKESHVSFLHVYHHSTTMMVAFIVFRYIRVEQALIYAGVNCTVHMVMYYYYFLTSLGYSPKWKKVVTIFQLFQFVSLFITTLNLILYQTHPYYIGFSIFSILQCLMYIYLFGKFYLKNYLKKVK